MISCKCRSGVKRSSYYKARCFPSEMSLQKFRTREALGERLYCQQEAEGTEFARETNYSIGSSTNSGTTTSHLSHLIPC